MGAVVRRLLRLAPRPNRTGALVCPDLPPACGVRIGCGQPQRVRTRQADAGGLPPGKESEQRRLRRPNPTVFRFPKDHAGLTTAWQHRIVNDLTHHADLTKFPRGSTPGPRHVPCQHRSLPKRLRLDGKGDESATVDGTRIGPEIQRHTARLTPLCTTGDGPEVPFCSIPSMRLHSHGSLFELSPCISVFVPSGCHAGSRLAGQVACRS